MRESGRRRGQKTNRKPDHTGLCRALGFYLECDGEAWGVSERSRDVIWVMF